MQRIRQGELEKVVLAREVDVHAPAPHDPGAVLGLLREAFGSSFVYAVGRGDATFIGATPELLLRRQGQRATTVALAGSTRRSADPAVDDHLGEQLLHSDKDRHENLIVARRIARALKPHAVWVTAAEEPVLVKVANIQHLAAPIRAQLAAPLDAVEARRAAAPDAGGGCRATGGAGVDRGPGGLRSRLVRGHRRLDRRDRRRGVLRRAAVCAVARVAGSLLRRLRDRRRLRSRRRAGGVRDQAAGDAAAARGLSWPVEGRPRVCRRGGVSWPAVAAARLRRVAEAVPPSHATVDSCPRLRRVGSRHGSDSVPGIGLSDRFARRGRHADPIPAPGETLLRMAACCGVVLARSEALALIPGI